MPTRQEEEYLKTLEQMFHDEPYLLSATVHIIPQNTTPPPQTGPPGSRRTVLYGDEGVWQTWNKPQLCITVSYPGDDTQWTIAVDLTAEFAESISPPNLAEGELTWCGYEMGSVGEVMRSLKDKYEDSSTDGRMFIANKIYDYLRIANPTSKDTITSTTSEVRD
jgi:hypothetical protein